MSVSQLSKDSPRKRETKRSRDWEQLSIAVDSRLLNAARARWASLVPARKMDLARCLAHCRRGDFTRSVKQVVSVTAGLRRRNDKEGREHLHNEPCVVFIVRQKLNEARFSDGSAQLLPRELLTPALIDGVEQVVAVPTDVQMQSRLVHARSQALTGVHALGDDGRSTRGALTWAVGVGSQRFALAPIHVLSPLPDLDGIGIRKGGRAALQGIGNMSLGPTLAEGTEFGGRIVVGAAPSFDAQLAKILKPTAFSSLFGDLKLSASRPWVKSERELDELLASGQSLEIFPPANNRYRPEGSLLPLQAVRSLVEHHLLLRYDFADGSQHDITHAVLELQVRFGERTYSGDSGCPVLLRDANDQFSLVGMHIAGNQDQGLAYAVPIWRLLSEQSYADVGGSLPGQSLKLVSRP